MKMLDEKNIEAEEISLFILILPSGLSHKDYVESKHLLFNLFE